jgi:L-ascorbate metabolism protein UlaG (beta-lactamase superfamily)
VVGDVAGFAVSYDPAVGALWFSGDTVLYGGVRQVAERIDVDIAVLHVGAVRFPVTGPLRYTMSIEDAIELCDALRPRIAIPAHYDGWSHFSQGVDVIHLRLSDHGDPRVHRFQLLDPGMAVDLSPPEL